MRNAHHRPVPAETKPNKALAAAITAMLAALGVTTTSGTTELVVAILGVLVNAYAVWRTYNPPKRRG